MWVCVCVAQGRLALTVRVLAEDGVDRVTLHVGESLSIADKDVVVVAGASAVTDSLAEAWDTFPDGSSGLSTSALQEPVLNQTTAGSPSTASLQR